MTAPLAASATSRLKWRRALEGHEALAMLGQWIDQLNLPGAIGNVASWLATSSASLLRGWILELLTVLLTEMNRLFRRIVETVQATVAASTTEEPEHQPAESEVLVHCPDTTCSELSLQCASQIVF